MSLYLSSGRLEEKRSKSASPLCCSCDYRSHCNTRARQFQSRLAWPCFSELRLAWPRSFFQCARAVALRRRLSLLSNHQLRSPLQEGNFVTWPAVRSRHSEKLRCFYLDAARTRLEKTSASLPLWARIPRVYIWNNELKRAKDAICERPLKTPVLSSASFLLFLAPVSSSAHYLLQFFHGAIFFTQ